MLIWLSLFRRYTTWFSQAYNIYSNIRNFTSSLECLISKQFTSRFFNCDIAMSKIFEYRPVKNRTIRYAAICVLSGNVAFGQNFIPHVNTCQLATKSLPTNKSSANRVLVLSEHQEAASRKCKVLSGIICYLSGKLTIFIEFRYSLSIFPGETHVLPGIIVEICRGKTEEKTKNNANKTKVNNIVDHSIPSIFIVSRVIQSVSQSICQPVKSVNNLSVSQSSTFHLFIAFIHSFQFPLYQKVWSELLFRKPGRLRNLILLWLEP